MNAKTLIDSYTDDVARRLPRTLRNEVGLELRALLTDELNTVANNAGRPPDREMALEVLRNFGRPEVVAARYAPRGFNVIEPEHAPAFVKLAVTCVAIQWALTLPQVFTGSLTAGDWWLGWGGGALWWVGFLAVYFAAAGWFQRRSPVDPHSFTRPWTHFIFWVPVAKDWQPGEEDIVYASGSVVPPLLFGFLTIFFVSPAWFLDFVLPASVDTSWALYDADFQRWLLAPLMALIVARLALFTLAVVNEGWRTRTEPVRFGLWVGFIGLLIWSLFAWDIFASTTTDFFFKAWLSIFVLVNSLVIVARTRRHLRRVRLPKALERS